MPKVILITGASTGFGRDTTETLARAEHRVFASMRDTAGKNRAHAEALRARGITVVELDVTSDPSVQGAVGRVLEEAGRIDVLVNNAGVAAAGVSEGFTADQVQGLFDVNVFGVQRVIRATLPGMRRQKEGLIVNVGSIVGRVTFPFFGLYGASKFAIEALTDSYRYELSQLGIDVVLVQPSAYPTPTYAKVRPPAETARVDEYGAIGETPGKMFETFRRLFQGPDAPDPHEVAEAIARLVGQAKGTRPDRVVVGQPFGSDVVNRQTAPIQAQVLEGLGLGHLAKIA